MSEERAAARWRVFLFAKAKRTAGSKSQAVRRFQSLPGGRRGVSRPSAY